MDQPTPVDLNKLKGILSASRKLMTKVESNDYTTGHIDSRALNQDGINLIKGEDPEVRAASRTPQSVVPAGGFSTEQINNSNLPPAVKKAMLERPIPQLTGLNHTFTLDDVTDDSAYEKPAGFVKPKAQPQQKAAPRQQIAEQRTHNTDLITISKTELKEMVDALVNEKLLEHYTKAASSRITEDAVKKTIGMMIKEGKLTPKKKIA
jgi:hypothetical protein